MKIERRLRKIRSTVETVLTGGRIRITLVIDE